jgi:hypothetical protein
VPDALVGAAIVSRNTTLIRVKHFETMNRPSEHRPGLPPGATLHWEITAAICVKVVLLWALWFLFFRTDGQRPSVRPNVAARWFAADVAEMTPPLSSQANPVHEEAPHVR